MIRPLLITLMMVFASVPAIAQVPLRIDLNIPALKLTIYEGDRPIETYPIAVGMPDFATPTGQFTITHAEWNPSWHPPTHREWARNEPVMPPGPNNPMGRVKLFFLPLYFIHGTPDGESIGTPASHGCVRMRDEDVVALARLIQDRAAPHVSEAELGRIIERRGVTRRVGFESGVDVVIRYNAVVVEGSEIFAYPDIYDYNAIHSESVYQALMAAGYDVSDLSLSDVRGFIDRATGLKAPLVESVDQAFGGRVQRAD